MRPGSRHRSTNFAGSLLPTRGFSSGALSSGDSCWLKTFTMTMHTLTVRDVRLKGWGPQGDTLLEVDEDSPLDWLVTFSTRIAGKFNNDVYLRICAHGRGIDG